MFNENNAANLVLSGGGVKGIAFIGAFETLSERAWHFLNIAGVSAGAIIGSILAAGYSPFELRGILDSFAFEKIKADDIAKRVPVISKYLYYGNGMREYEGNDYDELEFVRQLLKGCNSLEARGNILESILKICKQGCLFNGDYLEEWISGVLARKGIRTFKDLRGGQVDRVNPLGYKMRMTAVDATRAKLVVLPDDMTYYGIEPDSLEVAKAVRMSTSVPFVFKAVELKRKDGDNVKTHYLLDGGVFDNFPFWLIDSNYPTIGLRLTERKSIISLDTPLNILKRLISAVHDIGVPQNIAFDNRYCIKIDTSGISFLDFDLDEDEKNQLIRSGREAVLRFLDGGTRRAGTSNWHPLGTVLLLAVLVLGLMNTKNEAW
ncbi:MAG: patatin-like phospholipase family protein [Clostridia bacterium]|nr:patatin-like phospholipase family protein [Clostridia bacterium]